VRPIEQRSSVRGNTAACGGTLTNRYFSACLAGAGIPLPVAGEAGYFDPREFVREGRNKDAERSESGTLHRNMAPEGGAKQKSPRNSPRAWARSAPS